MEISTITRHGYKIQVIFTGANYYFYSPYFGLIATAERDYKKSVCNYSQNYREEHFTLKYGNDHCLGGSLTNCTIKAIAQNFITREENKFVPVTVKFDAAELVNLQNNRLQISMI